MRIRTAYSQQEIVRQLDDCLEVEFTFLRSERAALHLVGLSRQQQEFMLDWARRLANTNVQLANEFVSKAGHTLNIMPVEMIASWCLYAMDTYDKGGMAPAMAVLRDPAGYQAFGHRRAMAALFEQVAPVLLPFLQGLSGRRLKLVQDETIWTDGENINMPGMLARFDRPEDNFQLFKATIAHQWAMGRYGALNISPDQFATFKDVEKATAWFHALETIRLDHLLGQQFPGLYRQMKALRQLAGDVDWVDEPTRLHLSRLEASALDTLKIAGRYLAEPLPDPVCYQGNFFPHKAWQAREKRLLRDEARLRHWLRLLADEQVEQGQQPEFSIAQTQQEESWDLPKIEITHQGQALNLPPVVRDALNSLLLDFTELPPELLTTAGDGEYDPALLQQAGQDPEDAWTGAYHEEGAFLYDEWDFSRRSYRKNWCVLRELAIAPAHTEFYAQTLDKYRGHISSLKRSFELLRGENRILRRQTQGEDVDMDALVEGWGDVHAGLELSDRLFIHLHKDQRNLAAIIMVDMSGSTKGWVNDAEREALILLAEALETLGDRYAIYGFSGWARKRCELYRIKTFEQSLDDEVKNTICAIEARDYTRMGAPIRHFTKLLRQVQARTKLLVTISDGKPDDYDHYYRGQYGIEDTRQALFEARMAGIHPFCITIDKQGTEYLKHMYGRASFVVLDDVSKLPLKVSDIYRKITV